MFLRVLSLSLEGVLCLAKEQKRKININGVAYLFFYSYIYKQYIPLYNSSYRYDVKIIILPRKHTKIAEQRLGNVLGFGHPFLAHIQAILQYE